MIDQVTISATDRKTRKYWSNRKFRDMSVGVFLNHKEKVSFIGLKFLQIEIKREVEDKRVKSFKTLIANGPLLYPIFFVLSFF